MRAPVAGLTRRPEFLKVAAQGRKSAMPGLILQGCRRPATADPVRVGYTASRRVGGAVQRNRARRRLRAAAAAVMPQHARQGHDYVVIARTETLRRPFSALVHDLETALRRLDMWRDN
jgi:ribonuclease P protein component